MANIDDVLAAVAQRAPTFKRQTKAAADPAEDEPPPSETIAEADSRSLLLSTNQTRIEKERPPSEKPVLDDVADIAILVALRKPEQSSVLTQFGPPWRRESRDGIIYGVTERTFTGRRARVVLAVQNDMGLVPAAILANKTTRAWRPRLIAMVGICAGVKDKVSLGDVVVAKQVFDYGSGKIVDGRLHPDYQPVAVDEFVCQCAIDLASDKATMASIKAGWKTDTGKPRTELEIHVGAMASGAAVVADESIVEGIRDHKRSLHALDMEAYGIAKAASGALPRPLCLIIKGVQDFADDSKNDDYREYSSYASSQVLSVFLERYWAQLATLPR